ncbi:ATP-binding protein [Deltaproteobacteria bacterium TL4]
MSEISQELEAFFIKTAQVKKDYPTLIIDSGSTHVLYVHTGTGTQHEQTFGDFKTYLNRPLNQTLLSTFSEAEQINVQNWLDILSDEMLVELMMPEDIVKMAPSYSITWSNGQNYEMEFKAIRTETTYPYVLIWLEPHGESKEQQLAGKIIELMKELRKLPNEVLNNLSEYLPEMSEKLSLSYYAEYYNDPELIRRISRNLHASKGTVFFLGLGVLGEACHEAESLLEGLRASWKPSNGVQPIRENLNQLFLLTTLTEGIITRVQPDSIEGETVVLPLNEYYHLLKDFDQIRSLLLDSENPKVTAILGSFRHRLLMIDAIPLLTLFERFNSSVGKLAKELKKSVQFIARPLPYDVFFPRDVFESLWNAFYQVLKNSVDHGIETPEMRSSVNKLETGQIEFSVELDSEKLVLKMKDDGAGINAERVLQAALKHQLITEAEFLNLEKTRDTEAVYRLLLLPRFSTSEKITTVSGRGMGTDVIQKEVEKYAGNVSISSEPGQWTEFRITLPIQRNNILVLFPSSP